jgi:DNA-binding phage protein
MKRIKEVNEILDYLFEVNPYEWTELAKRSKLSISCIYNIGNYHTVNPRIDTVMKIAKAVGVKIDYHLQKLKMAN